MHSLFPAFAMVYCALPDNHATFCARRTKACQRLTFRDTTENVTQNTLDHMRYDLHGIAE